MKTPDQQADLLLVIRCLDGEASAEEEVEFRRRSEDPAFLQLCLDYQLDAALLPRALLAGDKIKRPDPSFRSSRRRRVRRPRSQRLSYLVPLISVALLCLALSAWFFMRPNPDLPQVVLSAPGWPARGETLVKGQVYQSPRDRAISLSYPDGSCLVVSPSSRLSFDSHSGKRLNLIEGSLIASVQPQATGEPFILDASTAQAKVLGTRFTFRAATDWSDLKVDHGAVMLQNSRGDTLVVNSGETAMANTSLLRRRTPLPKVNKLGTFSLDAWRLVPFVVKNQLYFIGQDTDGLILSNAQGQTLGHFGPGCDRPSVLVDNGRVHVAAGLSQRSQSNELILFSSSDLKSWVGRIIYKSPDEGFHHNTICKTDEGFVICLERAVLNYPARFLRSADLKVWTPMPATNQLNPGHYLAPHNFAWHKGFFYLFWTNSSPGATMNVSRSPNLKSWEASRLNPFMRASELDRHIAPQRIFTQGQLEMIAKMENTDNNEITFCELGGVTRIFYRWGWYVAEAQFDAPLGDFLESFFPQP